MTTQDTLLSFIARYHTNIREDVATDALSFVLLHSEAAQRALSEFLGDEGTGPLLIEKVQTRATAASGAVPDLICQDENDGVVAVIESKFWADLTNHQPVTYWNLLPVDTPAVLLVVAPESRADYLWAQLITRLRGDGHELDATQEGDNMKTALERGSQRRLMLTSWNTLLDRMAQHAWANRDWQASFQIAELQGLADSIIAGDDPRSDPTLKELVANAVRRLEQSGWGNATGLGVGQAVRSYWGRYLYLAGTFAWLGIEYKAWKQMPDRPLWLLFFNRDYNKLPFDDMRSRLETLTFRLEWRAKSIQVPIDLDTGAGSQARIDSVVSQIEHIGNLIDPKGPTYASKDGS